MINISNYILPITILFIIIYAFKKKKPIYDHFILGATEGLKTSFTLLPYLLSMILAVNIFFESNILSLLYNLFSPVLSFLKIPNQIFPLFFLRPLSSSASLAYVTNIIAANGVDSPLSTLSTIIQGSTDTTIYIITMYMGSIGIKKIKYALKVSLLADVFGILVSIFITSFIF